MSPDFKKNQNVILFKVQGFFAKMRKNLAPEQFKSLHQHARVKVLLNCSAGIKIAVQGSKPRNLTKNYINSTQIQGREFRNRWINIRTYSQIIDDSIKCGIMIISGVTRM